MVDLVDLVPGLALRVERTFMWYSGLSWFESNAWHESKERTSKSGSMIFLLSSSLNVRGSQIVFVLIDGEITALHARWLIMNAKRLVN